VIVWLPTYLGCRVAFDAKPVVGHDPTGWRIGRFEVGRKLQKVLAPQHLTADTGALLRVHACPPVRR